MTMNRCILLIAALGLALPAWSQRYPDRPVRMVVPLPAGGPLDVTARLFSEKLAAGLGQPFVIDNRAGAAGNIGMEMAAKAPPDGYTLLWVIDSILTVNPILYAGVRDPLESLAPVAVLLENPSTLVVHPSLPAKSSAELVKLSSGHTISYASAGPGSPGHRYMEFYKLLTGARMTHVPYKGNAPAVVSIITGETQAFISAITGVLPHVGAGRLRALAMTSPKRSPALPGVPTMTELGYPKLAAVSWFAVLVPAGTPQSVVDILGRELARIIQLPDIREKLAQQGSEPAFNTGKTMLVRARQERMLWTDIVQKTGMKID
jgi:tripartite-type tricarboxylate transporter receptor subunit TctC